MKPDALAPLWPWSPSSALVVEPDDTDSGLIADALRSAGFTVMVTHTFNDAKTLLSEAPPSLLVTEIRLGAYNGLQLAFRGRSLKPPMTIVLTSGYGDPVLQRDAERIGATFMVKPAGGAGIHRRHLSHRDAAAKPGWNLRARPATIRTASGGTPTVFDERVRRERPPQGRTAARCRRGESRRVVDVGVAVISSFEAFRSRSPPASPQPPIGPSRGRACP